MKALITNCVTLNGGDAAIVLAIDKQVREAFGERTEVWVGDSHADVARDYYPELNYRPVLQRRFQHRRHYTGRIDRVLREADIRRFELAARHRRLRQWVLRRSERAELAAYDDFDLVISTGGTYLVEHYAIWARLAELRVIAALGKPLVLYTQSLGPFEDEHNRREVKSLFGHVTKAFLRDDRSLEHVVATGAATDRCEVRPDVVFDLTAATAGETERERLAVVSVREWAHIATGEPGAEQYRQAMAAAVTDLVRTHGMKVMFASTCQGVQGYRDDSEEARKVMELLPADVHDRVSVDGRHHTPSELQALLASAELAICTRMHMAILALTVRTPVLAVAYEFKTHELFDDLGMADRVLDIDSITCEATRAALQRLIEDPTLPAAVATAHERAAGTTEALRWALASEKPDLGLALVDGR